MKITDMNVANAHVVITGGSSGIGLGLAKRFLQAGSHVLITARNKEKLEKAAKVLPGLQTFANDISDAGQREILADHIRTTMPGLNILINNAGIQRRMPLATDKGAWEDSQTEIDTLLSAPIHLNHLLIPTILSSGSPGLIVNVTSGGAYIPQVFAPVYSCCKAALHHYTLILRHAMANTLCRVVELIPPAVQTGLAGPGLDHGVPPEQFCDAVFPKLMEEEVFTVGYGPTDNLIPQLSGQPVADLLNASAQRFPVETYATSLPDCKG